ncbi:MAG: oligosaccharide flippase family protein [Chrysiogenia bacterium]
MNLLFLKSFLRKKLHLETRQFVKNSSWILGSNLVREFLVFLRSIVIARGLGVEFYGIYAMIVAFVMAIQEVLNLNIGTPFTKFGAEFKTENRIDKLAALLKGCALAAFVSSLASIVLIALLASLSYNVFFQKPGLHWFIVLFAISSATTFFDFLSTSLLRLYYKFKLNSIISIIMAVIEFLIVVTVIFVFPKNIFAFILAVVSARILNSAICNGIVFWELRHELGPFLKVKMSVLRGHWKEIGKFTVNNSLSRTVWVFINRADVLLLGALFGPVQVAYYNIGKRLANSISIITAPLATSIYPQLALLISKKNIADLKKLVFQLTKMLIVPALLFMIVMFFIKEPFITILYGKEFYQSASPFFFLILNAVLNAVFFWSLYLVVSLGMVAFRLWVYVAALVLGAATALLLVRFQATGMAVALLTANCFILFMFNFFAFKKLKLVSA